MVNTNRYFTLCSTVYLALGGGSHFALYLDSDLLIVKALVDCVMDAKRLMANYGVNVLIKTNRRDLPRDIPLDSVVVLRYEKRSKSENKGKVPTEMELVLEQTQQGTSYEVSSDTQGITVKMEILLEPTSNKLLVERFDTSAGNPVKEILLKLNLPDHRSILTDSKVTPTKHGQMTKP
ncbi:hypothetical protein Tco_1110197 [Tanacetum coccineum]|uniref:Uncharacterized protein n=1 Tax=Tanacetum coccineum TaxID=301880 RepID=A0ABQ5II66_9ASTR